MRLAPFVSAVTAAAFLTASMPIAAHAQTTSSPAPTTFRASIDHAASQAVAPVRAHRSAPVRKAQTMGGGGGGGGMMLMTLITTAAGLAGTYFLVKEMKKSNDERRRRGSDAGARPRVPRHAGRARTRPIGPMWEPVALLIAAAQGGERARSSKSLTPRRAAPSSR